MLFFDLFIDGRLKVTNSVSPHVRARLPLLLGGRPHFVTQVSMNWNIPSNMPIFHAKFSVLDEPILLHLPRMNEEERRYLLGYRIQSPRMPLKQSFVLLHHRADSFTIDNNTLSAEQLIAGYDELGLLQDIEYNRGFSSIETGTNVKGVKLLVERNARTYGEIREHH